MTIFTFDTSCGFCGFLMSGNLRFYGVGMVRVVKL